jgi:hypothetical protein
MCFSKSVADDFTAVQVILKVWLHLRTAKEGKGTGERITRTECKAVDTITLRIPKDYSGFNVTCANGRSDVGITYSPGK